MLGIFNVAASLGNVVSNRNIVFQRNKVLLVSTDEPVSNVLPNSAPKIPSRFRVSQGGSIAFPEPSLAISDGN